MSLKLRKKSFIFNSEETVLLFNLSAEYFSHFTEHLYFEDASFQKF